MDNAKYVRDVDAMVAANDQIPRQRSGRREFALIELADDECVVGADGSCVRLDERHRVFCERGTVGSE